MMTRVPLVYEILEVFGDVTRKNALNAFAHANCCPITEHENFTKCRISNYAMK